MKEEEIVITREESDGRLLRLAAFLEQLPPDRFDYSVWVGRDWKGATDLSCGTTACALGWATAMPEFQALGLYLELVQPDEDISVVSLTGPVATYAIVKTTLQPDSDSCIDAGSLTFGITHDQAEYLFAPECYLWEQDEDGNPNYRVTDMPRSPSTDATAKQVAEHIRRFVAWRNTPVAVPA